MNHIRERINTNRMRKVSRGLAFLGLFAMGSKKKVKILGGKVRILENKLYICGEKAAAVLLYRGLWQMGNRCIN